MLQQAQAKAISQGTAAAEIKTYILYANSG